MKQRSDADAGEQLDLFADLLPGDSLPAAEPMSDRQIIAALPESMRDLVAVIGLPAVAVLVRLRGGIRLCVPVAASDDHWLAQEIGVDAMTALCQHYGGEEIQVARCRDLVNLMTRQAMREDARGGLSNARLARKYGYTERWITALRKKGEW